VRNDKGGMVPASALTSTRRITGPKFTQALQPLPVRPDLRQRRAGYSSGQAMKALEETFGQTMPGEIGASIYAGMS